MVDITEYAVRENEPHTHIVNTDHDTMYLYVDDPHSITSSGYELLVDIINTTIDEGYHIQEAISDTCIPYVSFAGDAAVGAQFMYNIMKRLYNSFSPVAVLHNPSEDHPNVIVAPFARVNNDMLKEITNTFQVLCQHKDLPFTSTTLNYLPLTWDVTAYKEDYEMDLEVAFEDKYSTVLSTYLTERPVATKVKMNAAQAKRAALIDCILMYSRQQIKTDRAKAKELAPLLNINRSRDMSLFLTAGRCLYRIFQGDGEGLDLWRSICIPEMQDTCDEYWASLETTSTYYTVHTIQKWAMEDSPDKYKEWNSTSVRACLEASVLATGGISDIAGVAYAKDPTIFICEGDDPKDAEFFYFNGTYYQPCGIFKIQDYIEREVIPEYEDFNRDLSKLADANPDNNFKEMMQRKIDACIKIIKSLKDDTFQIKVAKILMRRYNKPGFDKIRDSSPFLTGFEDCILDLSSDMLKAAYDAKDITKCLRKGLPEDYITCSTGYKFMEEAATYHWDHQHVTDILDGYDRFELDSEKRTMIRRQIASALYASNLRKRKLLIAGPTNNGKSMLCTHWSKALGPVYFPSDVGNNLLYAMDLNPNAPTPSLDAVRFSRVLMQSEITDQHIMNEGLVKRLTGKVDAIAGRGMYARKMKSFIPKCTPVTVCNSFPKINGNSAALRTRMVVYTMSSKFVSPTDPEWEQIKDLEEEDRNKFMSENGWFYANPEYENIINRSYKAFMWVMIQDYIKYANEDPSGIVAPVNIPRSVQQDTLEYFTRSNIYLQFYKQACKATPGQGGVTTYAMYNSYKKWFSDNISRFGFVPYAKFLEELASMGIKSYNEMFNNITLTYQ